LLPPPLPPPAPYNRSDELEPEDFKSADEPQNAANPVFGSGVLTGLGGSSLVAGPVICRALLTKKFLFFGERKPGREEEEVICFYSTVQYKIQQYNTYPGTIQNTIQYNKTHTIQYNTTKSFASLHHGHATYRIVPFHHITCSFFIRSCQQIKSQDERVL